MLTGKNIIESYSFTIAGKTMNTILLSQSYLTMNDITITNLLQKEDYEN